MPSILQDLDPVVAVVLGIIAIVWLTIGVIHAARKPHTTSQSNSDADLFNRIEEYRRDFS